MSKKKRHSDERHDYQITLKREDLEDGDWSSRDDNPLALAIRRVLAPNATLHVDLRQEEFYVEVDDNSEWYNLPDEIADLAYRAQYDATPDPPNDLIFTFALKLPAWALP